MGSLALKREAFEANQIVGKLSEIVLMRNEGEVAQGPSEHCNLFEPESRVIDPSLPLSHPTDGVVTYFLVPQRRHII